MNVKGFSLVCKINTMNYLIAILVIILVIWFLHNKEGFDSCQQCGSDSNAAVYNPFLWPYSGAECPKKENTENMSNLCIIGAPTHTCNKSGCCFPVDKFPPQPKTTQEAEKLEPQNKGGFYRLSVPDSDVLTN